MQDRPSERAAAEPTTLDDGIAAEALALGLARPRRRGLWVALGLALVGGAVAAFVLTPRAYERLDLLPPVSARAYVEGGRPSPGTPAQRAFFEHELPALMVSLERGDDAAAAATLADAGAARAELPTEVRQALGAFGDACARAVSAGGDAATHEALASEVQRASAAVNRALAAAELGYYVDTQVTRGPDGGLRVFFETFVVEHVGHHRLGGQRERALSIRRLDHTNIALATLGFTRPEAMEGLVQVDRIEEHLVGHVLPALDLDAAFRFAEPQVRRTEALTRLEQVTGQALRDELLATLGAEERDHALRLGRAMHARRALFERWQALASVRDAVFYAPTTYEVDMDALEPHRFQLDGFTQLRALHRELGEDEVVRAYLHLRDVLVGSVARHELQHRHDYREGILETVPAGLAGALVLLEAGAPLTGPARVVVAELSAYAAAIADSAESPKTELTLLGRHLLGVGVGRRNEARAAAFLLSELDAALFPAEPIVGTQPVHYAARLERLLREPEGRLRAALRGRWESWFGRALPSMGPAPGAQ